MKLGNQEALSAEQTLASETTGSAHDVLVAARKLIEKKDDWFGGDNDANGRGQRCALLAIVDATSDPAATTNARLRLKEFCDGDIVRFNNHRTHAEVLAAFDKAIAATGAA